MTRLRIFLARAGSLMRGRVHENDLQQEIASHLEEATEDYVRQGLSPAEARRRALIGFGGVAQTHEANRDAGSFTWWNTVAIDLRDALRGLRAGKGTIALAFAILTVTLAAGTVTFSVTDAIVLRPLPYAEPERLIAIAHMPRTGIGIGAAASQDYFSWREGARSFDGLAAATGGASVRLENDGATQELSLSSATANLFDVLGADPVLGRLFTADNETAGRDAVVVLTHHAWTRSFNADPDVIGKRITLSQQQSRTSYEVLGVLAAGVTYPVTAAVQPVDVFRPYVATAEDRDHAFGGRAYSLHVVGRLKPGVTLVVGVVQNVRLFGPESDWRNELFIPMTQEPTPPNGELVIRTTGPAALVASAVRDAIRPVLSGPTVPEARFLDDAFRRLTAERRFNAGLMTIFGLLAAVIAAIGIYGTMAFVVAQQTRAIGLRMALGASQTSVLRSVLRESLWRVVSAFRRTGVWSA